MGVTTSTYYGLIRVREQSPEAKDWAATDHNPELIGRLMKYFEQHSHSGAAAINYPGYNPVTPTSPTLPTITESSTGGVLSPGVSLGVRLSYVNTFGLETDATPEVAYTIDPGGVRPLTPQLLSIQPAVGGVGGGTYIYAITKVKGSGETIISDVLPVSIPYDTTYSVTLQYNAINTYTDGTTAINIYRSAGLSQSFQLVGTITSTSAVSFIDTNTIGSGNANVQPPSVSTFDANKKIRISWSALTHPAAATALRVYVTQQTGLWNASHLLSEVDLTGTPATFIDYLGSEGLLVGWPSDSSEIPSASPKINLATDVTGALNLTADSNFNGFQISNFRVKNGTTPSTPANGMIYYDAGTNNIRAYINNAWVNWGINPLSTYTHPSEEAGGHVAANIKFATGSAVTSKTVFDTLRNSDGTQKNLTGIIKVPGTSSVYTTSSTSPVVIADMVVPSAVAPNFANQWAEISFSGHFTLDTFAAALNIGIEFDGAVIEETIRSITAPSANGNLPVHTTYVVQFGPVTTTKNVRVMWWVAGGIATSVASRRSLVVKLLA